MAASIERDRARARGSGESDVEGQEVQVTGLGEGEVRRVVDGQPGARCLIEGQQQGWPIELHGRQLQLVKLANGLDDDLRWQVINTGTTIITFLMVFLIQNTQNRDTGAIQIKLDELIRAIDGAHNVLLDLEELGDKELNRIKNNYEKLANTAREELRKGEKDTMTPEVDQ